MDDAHEPINDPLPPEEPVAPPPATTVHVAPPPPRRTSSYLLLGVNLLILVFAVVWVWSRMNNGAGVDPAHAAGGDGAATIRGGLGDDGTGGRVVEIKEYDRALPEPGSGLTRRKRGAIVPQPTFTSAASRVVDDGPVVQMDAETQRAVAATERNIDGIGVELEVVRAIKGAYPDSRADYGANRGIEALYEALVDARRTNVERMPTGDTDGDGRLEILDAWGNPLVYFSVEDYDSSHGQGWGTGDSAVIAMTTRSELHQRWQAPERFQLWSAGPNATNDNGAKDDITSWVIRE